jgi:hypothetical protein
VRDLTPLLLVFGNCCLMPFMVAVITWKISRANRRIRIEKVNKNPRVEDKTGPTARQIVRRIPEAQRRDEALGYGNNDKP